MTKKRLPRRLPPWGVGVQATLALAAVAAVGDLAGTGSLWGAMAGAVAALCAVLVEVGREDGTDVRRVWVQLVRCFGVGAWLYWSWTAPGDGVARFADRLWGWTVEGEPLSLAALAVLAAGCQVGAHLGVLGPKPPKEPGTGLVLMSAHRSTAEWQQRITARGGGQFGGVVVESVTKWDNGGGEDVRVCLPQAGATVDLLRNLAPGLAADANLPHGCSIEVIEPEGEGQRTVIMRVPTRVFASLDEGHPLWDEQRSILDGVPIGDHPNGDVAEGPMREESWIVVGKKGAGKTTLLWGITATVGMCRDALVWHIDLNGGGMTQPWVDVWLDGRVQRCPIDWAAPTIDEAIRMVSAAVRIAKHRKTAYRKRKKAANTNLLPVGPDLPEIVIILDEGAEAMAAAGKGKVVELAEKLEEIQRIARNEAVNLVLSVLRGTGDLVPASMSTQTGVGICMKVRQQKEIAAVFESAWELKLKPEHLTAKGAGWIGVDGGLPVRYQGWNILPDGMERVALRIGEVRPDLDEASAQAAGEVYVTREIRMRSLFADGAEGAQARQASAAAEEEPEESAPAGFGGSAASWADPDDIGSTRTMTRPALAAARTLLDEALEVFDDYGEDLVPREVLAARLTGGDEDELRKQMKRHGVSPHPDPFRWQGGPHKRGFARADVKAAHRNAAP